MSALTLSCQTEFIQLIWAELSGTKLNDSAQYYRTRYSQNKSIVVGQPR